MVRLFGEEKEPLLETYTDDVESNKTPSDAQREDELRAAEAAHRRRCRRRRRRIFHFLGITLLTFIFFGVRHYKRSSRFSFAPPFPYDEPHKLPVIPGVTLEHCTDWKGNEDSDVGAALFHGEDGYYIPPRPERVASKQTPVQKGALHIQVMPKITEAVSSWASFKLDAKKPLFFVSRGSFASGSLNVVQSEDESKDVKTTVTVSTDTDGQDGGRWHEHFLDVIRVCKIKKDGDEEATGVGIFVSRISL